MKNTPLHIAAKHGHYLIVKFLIEIGANPVYTNRDGQIPFDLATDSSKQIELAFVGIKNKIGGPGFDI